MTGNTLGERRYYAYESDTNVSYSYLTDKDLGDAADQVLDDTFPPFPRRFKPRGVYVQGEVDGKIVRKFLICGDREDALYTDGSQSVTIDSATFKTTGRRGESLPFGSNPEEAAPEGGGGT